MTVVVVVVCACARARASMDAACPTATSPRDMGKHSKSEPKDNSSGVQHTRSKEWGSDVFCKPHTHSPKWAAKHAPLTIMSGAAFTHRRSIDDLPPPPPPPPDSLFNSFLRMPHARCQSSPIVHFIHSLVESIRS